MRSSAIWMPCITGISAHATHLSHSSTACGFVLIFFFKGKGGGGVHGHASVELSTLTGPEVEGTSALVFPG